jgi:hypothetical protein
MIEPKHLLEHVIRPVLKDLDLWSEPAERLLLGTACQESECGRWLVQLGDGPALGIYQMEPATERDIWDNFLEHNDDLAMKVYKWAQEYNPSEKTMIGNLYYATAMCRVHYLRAPGAIPDSLPGQAGYWKQYYNSMLGKGTVQEYMNHWNQFIPPGTI